MAFNGLANLVAETVKKGEEYKVVGYRHERQDRGKTITEVYAATVKPPTKKGERLADQPGASPETPSTKNPR